MWNDVVFSNSVKLHHQEIWRINKEAHEHLPSHETFLNNNISFMIILSRRTIPEINKGVGDVFFWKSGESQDMKGRKVQGAGKTAVMNENYKTSVTGQTVMRYSANGKVGQSPLKMGPDGGVPCNVSKLLLPAHCFQDFCPNQANQWRSKLQHKKDESSLPWC